MTRQMPAGAQVAFAKDWFERQGIPAETIDVTAYIDSSLSYEENIKNLRRQFGAGKRGMDAPKVARGMTAAECDVAIGNFDAGYNGRSARDACTCGYQDACDKLERQRAKKAAAKRKPAATEPTATEVAWQAARLHEREAAASKTVATAKPEVRLFPPPDPKKKDYKPAKTWETFVRLNKPQITRHTAGIKEWASGIKDRKNGEKLFQREVREYRIAITDIWSKTKLETETTPKRKPAPTPSVPPILAAPPELAADVLGTEMGVAPAVAAKPRKQTTPTPQASRMPSRTPMTQKAIKSAMRAAGEEMFRTTGSCGNFEDWDAGGNREFKYPHEIKIGDTLYRWHVSDSHRKGRHLTTSRELWVVGGNIPPRTKFSVGSTLTRAHLNRIVKIIHDDRVRRSASARKPTAQKPTPSVPPILAAPLELAADVLGTEMGLPPTTAAKPPRTPSNCVYRVDEFEQMAQAWKISSSIPLQNSLDAAKKLVAKATTKRQRQIDKANRDWRPNAWGADPEHGPRRIVKVCNGKEVEYYPATKADEERWQERKGVYQRVGAMTRIAKVKPKKTAKPAARTAKKQPKKTAAAKTRKTTKKTAKPKAKKTAATPKLTPSQRAYLAINGFVMVKRGGKYVKVTGG